MSGSYYKTKESVEEYIRLAKEVNGQKLIDQLDPLLPAGAKLLELGTGPGTDWNILNQKYNVIGSDYSAEFISHLDQTFPNGEFLELDAITINTSHLFDAIYSNKVLIHLKDDELDRSLKRQYETLHPNGVTCHSFWKGNGSEIFKGLFVNYHGEKELQKAFEKYFTLLSIESYTEFETGDSLFVIAKKEG